MRSQSCQHPNSDCTAKDNNCVQPIAEILPGTVKPEHKPRTPIQERLVSMPFDDDDGRSLSRRARREVSVDIGHGDRECDVGSHTPLPGPLACPSTFVDRQTAIADHSPMPPCAGFTTYPDIQLTFEDARKLFWEPLGKYQEASELAVTGHGTSTSNSPDNRSPSLQVRLLRRLGEPTLAGAG